MRKTRFFFKLVGKHIAKNEKPKHSPLNMVLNTAQLLALVQMFSQGNLAGRNRISLDSLACFKVLALIGSNLTLLLMTRSAFIELVNYSKKGSFRQGNQPCNERKACGGCPHYPNLTRSIFLFEVPTRCKVSIVHKGYANILVS